MQDECKNYYMSGGVEKCNRGFHPDFCTTGCSEYEESAQTIAQQAIHEICPECKGHAVRPGLWGEKETCGACGGTGKRA